MLKNRRLKPRSFVVTATALCAAHAFDLLRRLVVVIPTELFAGFDVAPCEKRNARETRILVLDEDVLNANVGRARVVEEATQVAHFGGVVTRNHHLVLVRSQAGRKRVRCRNHRTVVLEKQRTSHRVTRFET